MSLSAGRIVAAALLLAFASGCDANEQATAGCKVSVDADTCRQCCIENGASNHSFIRKNNCRCRGQR